MPFKIVSGDKPALVVQMVVLRWMRSHIAAVSWYYQCVRHYRRLDPRAAQYHNLEERAVNIQSSKTSNKMTNNFVSTYNDILILLFSLYLFISFCRYFSFWSLSLWPISRLKEGSSLKTSQDIPGVHPRLIYNELTTSFSIMVIYSLSCQLEMGNSWFDEQYQNCYIYHRLRVTQLIYCVFGNVDEGIQITYP